MLRARFIPTRRSVHTMYRRSPEDIASAQRGLEFILRNMNMLNTLVQQQERTPLPSVAQRIREADIAWANSKHTLDRVIDTITLLPPGFRTSIDLKGYTLGYLVEQIFVRHGKTEGERLLEGLYFTGTTRDYGTDITYGEARERSPGSDRWYTPKLLKFTCDNVSIRMFPLSQVIPHLPQLVPVDDSFRAYLEELTQTAGGSDLTCYMMWENCYIYRMHNPPVAMMRTSVQAVRTGALRNIISEEFEVVLELPCLRNGALASATAMNQCHLFVPKGDGNCFIESCRWAINKRLTEDALMRFEQNPYTAFFDIAGVSESSNSEELEEQAAVAGDMVGREIDTSLLRFSLLRHINDSVNAMINNSLDFISKGRGATGGANNASKRKKLEKEMGFSTQTMNRFCSFMAENYKVLIQLYYEKSPGKLENRIAISETAKANIGGVPVVHVELFQMTATGEILKNDPYEKYGNIGPNPDSNGAARALLKADKVIDVTSKLVHCMAIHPNVSAFLPNTQNGLTADASAVLIHKVEEKTVPWMRKFYETQSLYGYDNMTDAREGESFMKRMVDYQNERYRANQTNTLIFNERFLYGADQINMAAASLAQQQKQQNDKRKRSRNSNPNSVMVFAFDFETVKNTKEIQDKVYPELAVAPPGLGFNDDSMEPMLGEIPFSAQWVAVNISDRGEFERRKADALADNGALRPLEEVLATFMPYEIDLQAADRVIDPGAAVPEKEGDYILGEAVTEYGGDQLGKCVDDMLVNMAECAYYNYMAEDVYAYAHNATHFDNYLVLQYNYRWPVVRILITPRGVMSATIQVTIRSPDVSRGETVTVRIHLRDTLLHVDGSLDALCGGFKVPKPWCKMDFPIRMVTPQNCYHPKIKEICKKYGENDVKALAYIIVKLNQLIGDSPWEPADPFNNRPPIAQFLTSMGVVRKSTYNHFLKTTQNNPQYLSMYPDFKSFRPNAVDVPSLRQFLECAAMGGRVCCMAKSYASPYLGQIVNAYLNNNTEELKLLHNKMLSVEACMVVLDATSLYPTAQAYCPMPLGPLKFLNREECENQITAMACRHCDIRFTLCPKHKYSFLSKREDLRPFSIIAVCNVSVDLAAKQQNITSICGRKIYNPSTKSPVGLEYTLETPEEMHERLSGKVTPDVQSYTNIDLYWMRRAGYTFNVLYGIGFDVAMTYNSFIEPAFQKRIEAKRAGNKLLSLFYKKSYNGSYGVTIQNDIVDGHSLVTFPPEMRQRSVLEPDLVSHLVRNDCLDPSEELTGESFLLRSGQTYVKKRKSKRIGEYYADQSPLQIGCAILAYGRHIMNLMMYNNPQSFQTYTDTDSDCVSEKVYQRMRTVSGLVNNTDDAPLGSFKNDHAENNGTEPRVVMAFYATKKAKLYMTLNAEGEIKLFNTFKGLKPSDFVDGKKMQPEYVEMVVSKALYEIAVDGQCENKLVTAWKRNLSSGVVIEEHWQHMDSRTYLGHAQGTSLYINQHGTTEYFVPFGSHGRVDFKIDKTIAYSPHHEGSKAVFEYVMDPRRKNILNEMWHINNYTDILRLIEKYYSGADSEYCPDDPTYQNIIQTFTEVSQECNNGEARASSSISE